MKMGDMIIELNKVKNIFNKYGKPFDWVITVDSNVVYSGDSFSDVISTITKYGNGDWSIILNCCGKSLPVLKSSQKVTNEERVKALLDSLYNIAPEVDISV